MFFPTMFFPEKVERKIFNKILFAFTDMESLMNMASPVTNYTLITTKSMTKLPPRVH